MVAGHSATRNHFANFIKLIYRLRFTHFVFIMPILSLRERIGSMKNWIESNY